MKAGVKIFLLAFFDILIIACSYILTPAIIFYIDKSVDVPENVFSVVLSIPFVIIIFVYLIAFFFAGMYRMILRYLSIVDMFKIITVNFLCLLFLVLVNKFIFANFFKTSFLYSVILIGGLIIAGMSLFVRLAPRAVQWGARSFAVRFSKEEHNNVLIYGAGTAGMALYRDIHNSTHSEFRIICFYDDDITKKDTTLFGLKVYNSSTDLVYLTKSLDIHTIIIAIPSASTQEMKEIITRCNQTDCKLKTLPALYDLIAEGVLEQRLIKDVDIYDILGREEAKLDLSSISQYLTGKTILVTGGGGSIGSEIARQVFKHKPGKLILLDIYENNVYDIENELRSGEGHDFPIVVYIGSIRDYERMEKIFKNEKIDLVFHAAAHKHVPLMEMSPGEAIKNNVFGTLNVVELANKYSIENFVLISTDKAVNPTNVMGATKRLAEIITQSYGTRDGCKTKFAAVRFGNVLGSNGSVVPLFQKQIGKGGPVTVTDPEVTRFFMTIPEASRLVIQAGAIAKGGEIFILDMGKSIKIAKLAEDMISLSGFVPYKDIDIVYTGLRPGEKLYEELLQEEEGTTESSMKGIFIGKPISLEWNKVLEMLEDLRACVDLEDNEAIVEALKRNVSTYNPNRDSLNIDN